MSYAIGYVFYGVDLNNRIFDKFANDRDIIFEADLATSHYSGSDDSPLYIGSNLCMIDECRSYEIANLKLTPSEKDILAFEKAKKNLLQDSDLSDEFKTFLSSVEPKVMLVWGSS